MLFYITNSRFLRTQWTPTCVGVTVCFCSIFVIASVCVVIQSFGIYIHWIAAGTAFPRNDKGVVSAPTSSYRRRPVSIVFGYSGPRPGITHKIKILRGPIVGVTVCFCSIFVIASVCVAMTREGVA